MWIYGVNPVRELLRRRPGAVSEIRFDRKTGAVADLLQTAERFSIPVKQSSKPELQNICGSDAHQGLIAKAPLPDYVDLEKVISNIEQKDDALILILDSISDPQNLGSIIRVAETAGVDAVIIPRDRAAGLSPSVAKASAGAVEWTNVCRVTNLKRAIDTLKGAGFWVMGTSGKEGEVLWQVDLNGKLAVVIGSEGKGMRPGIAAACDRILRIPLQGKVGSLNASVSAGIILFEILRQRRV